MPQDETATEKTINWNRFIFGDKNPKQYSYSLARHVLSDIFKERLVSNSNLMRNLLNCCARTADNYAIPMTFTDLLFDEFGAEMAARGLTREKWLQFVKNVWVKCSKEITMSNREKQGSDRSLKM